MRNDAARLQDVLEDPCPTVHRPRRLKQRSFDRIATTDRKDLPCLKLLSTQGARRPVERIGFQAAPNALGREDLVRDASRAPCDDGEAVSCAWSGVDAPDGV